MPRCLRVKKWKAYPWPDQADDSAEELEHQQPQQQQHGIDGYAVEAKRARLEPQEQQQQQQQQQVAALQTDDEEIDVVGDVDTTARCSPGDAGAAAHHQHQTCWGPHSPTAGATAPSPPPLNASGALYYHGYTHEAWLNHEEPPKYATLRSAAELARPMVSSPTPSHHHQHQIHEHQDHSANPEHSVPPPIPQPQLQSQQQQQHQTHQQSQPTQQHSIGLPPRKSLSMCFTSTGTALSLPPKKKDIYRPYSLQPSEIRTSAEEDLSAAQAILDLSASPAAPTHSIFIHTLSVPPQPPPPPPPPPPPQPPQPSIVQPQQPVPIPVSVLVPVPSSQSLQQPQPAGVASQEQSPQQPRSPATAEGSPGPGAGNKTVAYTYEAFFVSDGRSKRRSSNAAVPDKDAATQPERPKFTCTECGKQYATSSNLSRHKQTHRSLDSQSAKKCIHCGKAYVSMPALAMHVLTHKLAHSCGVCGKMFSRPWLLQGHLRSHTGEKPYGCAHCGKAFADRSNLRAHMQTHSADKNYECSRCHKTFALKSYLNKHLESACLRDEDSPPPQQQSPPQQQAQPNNRGL